MHTLTHAQTHIHVHLNWHASVHLLWQTRTCTCAHTHTHSLIHTHTHYFIHNMYLIHNFCLPDFDSYRQGPLYFWHWLGQSWSGTDKVWLIVFLQRGVCRNVSENVETVLRNMLHQHWSMGRKILSTWYMAIIMVGGNMKGSLQFTISRDNIKPLILI